MSLCHVCRKLKLSNLASPEGQVHRIISDLRVSARDCDLCSIFHGRVSKNLLEADLEEAKMLRIYGDRFLGSHDGLRLGDLDLKVFRAEASSQLNHDLLGVIHMSRRPAGYPEYAGRVRFYADPESPAALSGDVIQRPINPPDEIDQVKRWEKACSSSHNECGRADDGQDSKPVLPTRVLNVGRSPGFQDIFLYETVGERHPYLALSHRWGGAKFLTTTSSNISSHRRHIDLENLCKTFQDAIVVTRKLGHRYLWIDSLCIIQDSSEDWERESSRMGEVYSNATLTLSAACAVSGDTGLFQAREPAGQVKVPFLSEDGNETIPCFISDHQPRSFDEEVREGPLSQRAWTLQERYLSKRVVHYGLSQLHWECQEKVYVEGSTAPVLSFSRFGLDFEGLHKRLKLGTWNVTTKLGSTNNSINCIGYLAWYRLVEEYSRRSLANGGDKLPAFSGLARLFAKASGDEYLAGLWKKDLLVGLIWHKSNKCPSLHRPSGVSRAPSWSWASCDGDITYGDTEYQSQLAIESLHCTVVDCTVVYSGQDLYGKVKSGRLSVTGIVKICRPFLKIGLPDSRSWYNANGIIFVTSETGDVRTGEIAFDNPDPVVLQATTYCLLLFSMVEGPEHSNDPPYAMEILEPRVERCYTLLLKESDIPGSFVRVGLGRTDRAFFENETPRNLIII